MNKLITPMNKEVYKLRLLEAKLSKRMIRRKDRRLSPIRERVRNGFAQAFRIEKQRVLEKFDNYKSELYAILQQSSPYGATFKIKLQQRKLTVDEIDRFLNGLATGINTVLYERILSEAYVAIFKIANAEAELQISTTIGWNVRHRVAEEWIRTRSNQFINKYLPLVEESTINDIQIQLLQGVEKGENIFQIRDRLVGVYNAYTGDGMPVGFVSRAETWARTETNRAYSNGTLEAYKDMGVQKKFWISSGSPYALIDVCGENAAMGSIGINEYFKDVKNMPIDSCPAHPNCECNMGYDVSDDWIPNESTEII